MTFRAVPGQWWRYLGAALAAAATAVAISMPAAAAPSSKYYSAALSGADGTPSSQLVVSVGTPVTLSLSNSTKSQQSFGSAELVFSGDVAPTSLSVPAGWSASQLSGGTWLLVSATVSDAIAPGQSLGIGFVPDAAGQTKIVTSVKQSNDYNGTNNWFVNTGSDPTLVTVPSDDQICTGSCSTSPSNTSDYGITATASMSSTQPFGYSIAWGDKPLNAACADAPFGPTVTPQPLVVETSGPAGVGKSIRMTFPKNLVNLAPNNGTPWLSVCAGAAASFPGSTDQGTAIDPSVRYQGLLLTCDDPTYLADIQSGDYPLHVCISSRSKNAGNETIGIRVDTSTLDPSFW